jgi:Uma2 family endonuclease
MSQLAHRVTPSVPPKESEAPVPPLQPGDHLTRPEFERRFDVTPALKKAELVEGIVYMPPPVSIDDHAAPHFDLITLLGVYRSATPGVRGADNGSARLDLDNMPQPDIALFIDARYGGQAKVDIDGYLAGAPELIAEIAASSASYDLHEKLRVYLRNGAKEYVVWRTFDRAVDYFVLRAGDYQRLTAGGDGLFRSEVFPGLWLDAAALIAGDLAMVLHKLQQGVASPEHAAFVSALQQRASQPPASS